MLLARLYRLIALLGALFVLASPAHADLADKVFELLKSKGGYVGINPDGVEMARYSYLYDANGEEVIKRAAEEDIPFFAMVGAVKSAKFKTFPKIGVFDEKACLFPVSAVDVVFAKAADTVSSLEAKQKVAAAIADAQGYSEEYLKENLDSARKETNAKLLKNVPYFKDIPLICHFSFHTDFKLEHDLQNTVIGKVKEVKAIYKAFKAKDITKGAELLIGLGFSADVVCDMVDSALDSSGVGAIPGVDTLSNGLCKSFVGKVVGKAIKKGVELAKDAACAVYDWFGGSCNEDVKTPPTGIGNAKAFCAPYGGLQSALSKTNAPDDYLVNCNSGMKCAARPGKPLVCTTLAQVAQMKQDEAAQGEEQFKSGLKYWVDDFKKQNIEPCFDQQCKGAMSLILASLVLELKKLHAQRPGDAVPFLTIDLPKDQLAEIGKIKAEAEARKKALAANAGAAATDQMHALDCKNFLGRADQYLCASEPAFAACVGRVKKGEAKLCLGGTGIAKTYGEAATVVKLMANQACKSPGPASLQFTCENEKGRMVCQRLVAGGMAATCQVASAAAAQSSGAIIGGAPGTAAMADCKPFLGRVGQFTCSSEGGFQSCIGKVKAKQATLCFWGAKAYGEPHMVIKVLAEQGCQSGGANGAIFTCSNPQGKMTCQHFLAGGLPLTCN